MTTNSEQKAFTITAGKGFALKFPNGYTVSVQFGPGNYSDNRHGDLDYTRVAGSFIQGFLEAGQEGSNTAETAVIGPDGEFIPLDENGRLDPGGSSYGDVQGYQTLTEVLALLVQVAGMPAQIAAPVEPEEVQGELA